MEQTGQQDLFDIKLTASGKLYIRKLATIVRALIIVGILISLLNIVGAIIRIVKVDPAIFAGNKLLSLHFKILPVYTVVSSILFFFQLYYYWQISKYLSKGTNYNDEAAFNESFRALYRNAVFGVITLALAFVMNFFQLYLEVKFYLN